MNFDPIVMLERLVAHEVDFILIGGTAAAAHGSPTPTLDVDICYSRSPDNLERLAGALVEMGAKLRGVEGEVPFLLDAKTLAAGDHFTLTTEHGALDLLGTPAGTSGYVGLLDRSSSIDVGGTALRVASIDDLMKMKEAAGRPKDRIELEILGALKAELEGRN